MMNCIKCGCELTDENWHICSLKHKIYTCKKCRSKHSAEYNVAHPEKAVLANKKYRETHKEILSAKAMEQYAKNKKVLSTLKINGCALCGYDKCERALDFHHVNSEDKKFNINSSATCYADKRVAEEINKCILLCANCHREIHEKEFNYKKGVN